MNPVLLLKPYLLMNFLLLGAYLLFRALRAVSPRLGVGHRHWITVAQMLILISCAAPLALRSVPEEKLPEIGFQVLRPASEGTLRGHSRSRPGASRAEARLAAASRPVSSGLLQRLAKALASEATASALWSALIFICVGMAFSFFRLARCFLSLRALLAASLPVRVLGRVSVVVSDSIRVPFSARLGRRWVALPGRILLSGGDFRLAVRHELQHHRQGDTSWAMAVEVLVCLFFFNPAVYCWKRDLIELQEFSCDEALIGRRGVSSREYGSCLVRVAEAALGARPVHAGTTCMASVSRNPFYLKSFLRRRIEMFAFHQRPRVRAWAGILVGTAAAGMTVALAFGAEKASRNGSAANPGQVVVDPEIQEIADHALADAIRAEKAKAGFAVVADPKTGRVLAVANIDTTEKRAGQTHWALSQVFEPASIAKSLVAAEAIETGVTTPQERHSCENGSYRLGGHVYRDWRKEGWDQMTTEETIAKSGDICAIKIGEQVGAEGLRKMLKSFGFGPDGTASTFPEARPGVLPPPDHTHDLDLIAAVSIGSGFRVTPLEMVQAYGAIANGGNLMEPENATDSEPRVIRRVLSSETSQQMREILHQVVLKGTGHDHAESALYTTAGKTASAYLPDVIEGDPIGGARKSNFAGFIGFAPYNDPRVEVYVGIRDPGTSNEAHGAMHAAPVFLRIVDDVLQHWKVAPDKPRA